MQSLTNNFTSKIKLDPFNEWLKIASLTVLLVLCFGGKAQNMVINSSFENYSQCPDGPAKLWYAVSCSSPPQNDADYLNRCSTNSVFNVPTQISNNQLWTNYQEPHFGDAYVGLFMYGGGDYREYLQMEINGNMDANKYYNVEFWANRANGHYGGRYAINNIGLAFKQYFSDTTDCPTQFCSLLNTIPSVLKFENPIIDDTLNWVKINGIYQANGAENYLVIGNFFPNSQTDTINVNDSWATGLASYYFIEDVLVEEITQPFWQYHDTTVYYGDSVLIGPALTGLDIDWYTDNLDFISNAPGIYVTPPTSRDYIAKETFNGVETDHVVHVTVIGGAGLEENELQNVRVFPNPSKGIFSISGITSDKPLQLEVRDVHGKLVFEEKAFSKELNSFALDVENGIYFVTVSDLSSKSSVVEKLVISK